MEHENFYEEILATNANTTITFPGMNSVAVKINFNTNPPTLWVNPDLAWDQAAKQFWNAAYRCIGKPALFPESEM